MSASGSPFLRARQLFFTGAKTLLVCAGTVWVACYLHASNSAGHFADDVENLARWAHMYSQEEMATHIHQSAAQHGVVLDLLDVEMRDSHVFIRVNYHASYRFGPYQKTYVYEKRAAAPAVAWR